MADETTPTADPAWVVGPGPDGPVPASLEGLSATKAFECAACHARTLDWADKATLTCWVCGRETDNATGDLLPRPEPEPDAEYNPR